MSDSPAIPPIPADSDRRLYVLVAENGKLRWMPALDDAGKTVHSVRVAGIRAVRTD